MKLLDVAGTGMKAVKAAVATVAQVVAPARVARQRSRMDGEENALDRQDRINREAAGGWLDSRPDWLNRGL